MSKHMMWALLLIVLAVVVMLFNNKTMDLELLVTNLKVMKSIVFLGFTIVGVAIGMLLK